MSSKQLTNEELELIIDLLNAQPEEWVVGCLKDIFGPGVSSSNQKATIVTLEKCGVKVRVLIGSDGIVSNVNIAKGSARVVIMYFTQTVQRIGLGVNPMGNYSPEGIRDSLWLLLH